MKNWRRILVTGMVAGMIVFTGCSSNLPETNQGNRNGQRVVDAVNRRTDTYETTRGRNIGADRAGRTTRGLRGFNRGLRRAARNDGRNTASTHNNYRHDGVSGTYAHPGVNRTHRATPNHNVANPHRGRVGHTFRYTPNEYASNSAGYDLGMYDGVGPYDNVTPGIGRSNNATVNNRVVRSTPRTNATSPRPAHNSSVTRKATGVTPKTAAAAPKTNVTRSTTPAAPKTNATRSTTPVAPKTNVTRNTAPKTNVTHSAAPVAPKANRNTAPKANVTNTTRSATPKRKTTHVSRPTRSTQPTRKVHPAAKNTRTGRRVANKLRHESVAMRNANAVHPAIPNVHNVRPIENSNAITRHDARPSTRSIAQNRAERARGHYTNAGVHHMQNIANPNSTRSMTRNTVNNRTLNRHQSQVHNRRARRVDAVNARRANNVNNVNRNVHEQGVTRSTHNRANVNHYGLNHANSMVNNYVNNDVCCNIHGSAALTHNGNLEHGLNQAVTASAVYDESYAFFKRNKSENNETPATPEPGNPQAPTRSNRVAPMPSTSPVPAPVEPTGMAMGYNNSYDHAPGIDADYDRIHDLDDDGAHNEYDGHYGNQLKPLPKSEPGKSTPVRRANHRAMK